MHIAQPLLHFLSNRDQVNLAATAGGAAYQFRIAATQAQCGKQRPAGAHFFGRVVGQGDAHGIPYSLLQKNAQAARRFDKTLKQSARLGNTDMQGNFRHPLRKQAIRCYRGRHIMGLGGNHHIIESLAMAEFHVCGSRFNKLFGQG